MMNNGKEVRVHLFVSRNKDNLGVENFKPRKVAFVTSADDEKLKRKFLNFVNEGVDGEYCRHYKSLNVRDEEKIREELIVRLVKNKVPVEKINKTVASIASLPECAAEKKWLFDFDSNDPKKVDEFLDDLKRFYTKEEFARIKIIKTVNNFSVIVPHGIDTRSLKEKWAGIFENKRDTVVFVEGKIK